MVGQARHLLGRLAGASSIVTLILAFFWRLYIFDQQIEKVVGDACVIFIVDVYRNISWAIGRQSHHRLRRHILPVWVGHDKIAEGIGITGGDNAPHSIAFFFG